MSSNYYEMCRNRIGKGVEIRTRDGRVHRGVLSNVTQDQIFLRPIGPTANLGGFGYGFPGRYGGYGRYRYGGFGWGWGWGIALAAIVALAFLPFFFW